LCSTVATAFYEAYQDKKDFSSDCNKSPSNPKKPAFVVSTLTIFKLKMLPKIVKCIFPAIFPNGIFLNQRQPKILVFRFLAHAIAKSTSNPYFI